MTYFQITLLIGLAVFVGFCVLFYCDERRKKFRSRVWHATGGRISVARDAHLNVGDLPGFHAWRQKSGMFSDEDTWHHSAPYHLHPFHHRKRFGL